MSTRGGPSGYTRSDWAVITCGMLGLLPFVGVRFLGWAEGSALVAAIAMGAAIVTAAFFLSWAVEGLETGMPQAVAIAILALIEIAPEYAFEAILAFRQKVELAAASMTGANRLLLGVGWPLIMFVAYLGSRRRGKPQGEIRLDERQSLQLAFLLLASCYAFVIVAKRSISLVDTAVLALIYGGYMYAALVTNGEEQEDLERGIGIRTKKLPPVQRWMMTAVFLAFAAFVLYFGAEPFLDSVIKLARQSGMSEFALIQWLVPFLSEFPESLTAFIWAAMVVTAGMGLSNLISSKLNQWTLLIATIPIAYSLGAGRAIALPLTPRSREEVFLTAAQSLFGISLLLDRRFTLRRAAVLLGLFLVQFVFTNEMARTIIAWVYLMLLPFVIVYQWPRMRFFADLRCIADRAFFGKKG